MNALTFKGLIYVFFIQNWLAQAREFAKDNVQITLVGNKNDLPSNQRKVKPEEARREFSILNIQLKFH